METKTKEYKKSIKPENAKVLTVEGLKSDENIPIDLTALDEHDVFDNPPKEGVYIKDAYAKVENNPKFRRCMHCWTELPPNEDGSPRYRRVPEACPECIWRNA